MKESNGNNYAARKTAACFHKIPGCSARNYYNYTFQGSGVTDKKEGPDLDARAKLVHGVNNYAKVAREEEKPPRASSTRYLLRVLVVTVVTSVTIVPKSSSDSVR